MGISVSSSPVNVGITDPSQNKADKAKAKADEDQNIQNKKEAKNQKKDHGKLLKSLYVSRDETAKNFGLAGKSLLGSKPILAPWKEKTDSTSHAKDHQDDSNTSSAKDEHQSTNKSSSKTFSNKVATSSKQNLEKKSSLSPEAAKNQSKKNVHKNNKTSTTTKATDAHGKTAHPKDKISKAHSGNIQTEQELDEFVDELMNGVKDFRTKVANGERSFFKTEGNLKGKSKDGLSAATLFNDEDSSLESRSKPEVATESSYQTMSEFNKLHQTKAKKFSRYGSEIGGDQKDSKDNKIHLNRNIPDHILDARKRSMALKGNIHNIANSASLQSLINRYLDTRGSYAIKIMMEMEKLKTGKHKTAKEKLADAKNARSLASDRQISTIKEVAEKQAKAEKERKTMGIVGIVMAAIAIIVSVLSMVLTGGLTAPAVIVGIVAIIAGIVALGITSANFVTKTVDGRTMGTFDACIYKLYRKGGASIEDALKDTQYTGMAIQGLLVLLTFGSAIATAASKIGTKIIQLINKLASKLGFKGIKLSKAASEVGAKIASQSRVAAQATKHTLQVTEGILMGTNAGLNYDKTKLESDATKLQAQSTQLQSVFENVEQHEHVAQLLLQKSIKRIAEMSGSVAKTLEAEYQAIKLLNMKSKVS